MGNVVVPIVLAAWVPVVAVLFRVLGARRAALVAVFGGLLFLPRVNLIAQGVPCDKRTATGLGLILGVLLFGRADLARWRWTWLDLPVLGYALAPLIGLATGVPGAGVDIVNLMVERSFGWVVLYAIGRLYFGDEAGARRVAVAIVVSGLVYIPICLFEEIAGPRFYLSGLIYGTEYNAGMVDRLGGWRPEGFLVNGLEVAAWMALATVLAVGIWLGGAWRPPGGVPAWGPALALLLTTLSCRGVYGYIILTLGLATTFLSRWLRTRVLLLGLILVSVGYMAARLSGTWSGSILARGAALTGRASTVEFRLIAEDQFIGKVISRNLIFGFGNYVWHSDATIWPDGLWLHALWNGGLVGLALTLGALQIIPATLALMNSPGRPTRAVVSSPAWGLATWCLLLMVFELHNTHYFSPLALVSGTLIGLYSQRNGSADRGRDAAGHARYTIGSPASVDPVPFRLVRLGLVALALAVPELVAWAARLIAGR